MDEDIIYWKTKKKIIDNDGIVHDTYRFIFNDSDISVMHYHSRDSSSHLGVVGCFEFFVADGVHPEAHS